MKCVICKTGEVHTSAGHRAEVKVGADRLLVMVEAEVCDECGEAYYSADALRQIEKAPSAALTGPCGLPKIQCGGYPGSTMTRAAFSTRDDDIGDVND